MNKKVLSIGCFACCGLMVMAYFLPCVGLNIFFGELKMSFFNMTFGNEFLGEGEIENFYMLLFPLALIGLMFIKKSFAKYLIYAVSAVGWLLTISLMIEWLGEDDYLQVTIGIGMWIYLLGFIALVVVYSQYLRVMNKETLIGRSMIHAVCMGCGNQLQAGVKFCGRCGMSTFNDSGVNNLIMQPVNSKKCPVCGNACSESGKFCDKCGAELNITMNGE